MVGLDKEEIIETAKAIGTYETSILPYEDCCVLFSPKHPVLKASVEEAQRLYQELEAEELIQAAFDRREHKKFSVQVAGQVYSRVIIKGFLCRLWM